MNNNARINPIAVVLGGIIYWLVQAGWYTLFSRPWLEGVGKTMTDLQQGSPMLPYLIALACDVAAAFVLAWVVTATGEQTAARGVLCGILLSLGLIATTLATTYTFERRSLQFFLINAGCPLVALIIVGALVGAWKGKAA